MTSYCFGGFVEEEPLPEAGGVELLPEVEVPEELLDDEPGALAPLAAGALLPAAGGVAAGAVVDCEDGCLAHAVKSTAAASALRTTFIFIDNTPVE